jgi:hypothetical protein
MGTSKLPSPSILPCTLGHAGARAPPLSRQSFSSTWLGCSSQKVFEIFLDLKAAYDSVDRARTQEILQQYGVWEKVSRLLRHFWGRHVVVAKQGGHFSEPFQATRWVPQGDITSLNIFNIVVDAVIRYWLTLVLDDGSEYDGFGRTVREQLVLFYVNDGLIAARNHEWLQMAM